MSRDGLPIPAGWAPTHNTRVELIDATDSPAPPGLWRVTDRAPDPGCWWLTPADETAARWLAARPAQAVQQHLLLDGRRGAHSRRMVPAGFAPLPGTQPATRGRR